MLAALEAAYTTNYQAFVRHALRHGCRSYCEAEDVVASIFLALLRRAHAGTLTIDASRGALRTYICGAITKGAHSQWNRYSKRMTYVEDLDQYISMRWTAPGDALAFLECLAIDLPRAVLAAATEMRDTKRCTTDPELLAVTFADVETGAASVMVAADRVGCANASMRSRLSILRGGVRRRLTDYEPRK